MVRSTLSTSDNPFNPFTQYDLWRGWDESLCQYNSNSYLARVAPEPLSLNDEDEDEIREAGISEILEDDVPIFNPLTRERVHYIRVTEPA